MRKLFLTFITLAVISAAFITGVHAEVLPLVIDDMHTISGKMSPNSAISREIYTDETSEFASGKNDTGFIYVKKDNYTPEESVILNIAPDTSVNLYRYSELTFKYRIPSPVYHDGRNTSSVITSVEKYTFTLTLFSENEQYSVSIDVHPEQGGYVEWSDISFPLSNWSHRESVTSISISLSATYSSEKSVSFGFMIDSLSAEKEADTRLEDIFMSSSFVSFGSSYSISEDLSSLLWRLTSPSASLTGNAIFEFPEETSDHNALRLAVTSSEDVEIKLLISYKDGTGNIGTSVTALKTDSTSTVFFELPNAKDLKTFTFSIDGASGALIKISNIDTLFLPQLSDNELREGVGSVDICRLDENGDLNLRGNVPSDVVADNLKGSLLVLACPIYEDPTGLFYSSADSAEDIISSGFVSVAEAAMSTRFNITVSKETLPHGSGAMIYSVFVKSGDSLIMIGSPTLPNTADAGTALPDPNKSIKGLAADTLSAENNAAVTEVTVDLSLIFDSTSSGRIYSSFGRLYYFDTDYLKKLDSKIKSLSLSGTNVYLRFVKTSSEQAENESSVSAFSALTANNEEELAALYSAVDFITDRYSSLEYGYIRGIILGNSENDLSSENTSPASHALNIVKAAATVYGAAGSHIRDLRLLLPFGDDYITSVLPSDGDNELLLGLIAYYAEIYGLPSYGILWQTDSAAEKDSFGIKDIKTLKNRLDSMDGTSPSYIVLEFTSIFNYFEAAEVLRDYVSAYYSACEESSISSFIFKFENTPSNDIWNEFISYFSLLDTDKKDKAENYLNEKLNVSFNISENAASKAFPHVFSEVKAKNFLPNDVIGSYKLFDYASSFDTGGWFSIDPVGECVTVKTTSGRAMRASNGGIMYSYSQSADLSASPIISISSYSTTPSICKVTFFSPKGSLQASFSLESNATVSYIDISDFVGKDSVSAILITDISNDSTLYVNNISCHSKTLDSESLTLSFEASYSNEKVSSVETNIVELVAVIFIAFVLTAAAFFALRRE